MARVESLVCLSMDAGEDLSTHQFKFVKVGTAANSVVLQTAATIPSRGVLMNKPALGSPAQVAVGGMVKVLAGAVVAVGALVTSDGTARAITAVATNVVFGQAMTASTAAGQLIEVIAGSQNIAV